MTIYTRTGDRGKTGLLSGERITKDDIRIEAYGTVDELNSIIGALIAILPQDRHDLIKTLRGIQTDLFTVGAWMSVIKDSPMEDQLQTVDGSSIADLEAHIDTLLAAMPTLTHFILPGGHPTAAWAHLARSVCRRAERHAVHLYRGAPEASKAGVYETILCYLNRLSDYFFVLARYCNFIQDIEDIEWAP
jgi:cob(I)alamin adenosyltransferase